MARPKGHSLNRAAWDDLLDIRDIKLPSVAKAADVPPATLRSLRGGFHRATLPQMQRLADVLGVQPATLFPTLDRDRFLEAEKAS